MPHAYALITGATGGIGSALAEALAAEGRSLLLTGRRQPLLEQLQARLRRPGIEVRTLVTDLNRAGAGPLMAELQARDWQVDLLINNAGLGSCGYFSDLDLARELEIVQVNVAALVELTRGCVPAMVARGTGAVMNVASTAAFQPVPGLATYAASKAFVLSFSRALHEELRGHGVHVMALCPGPTETGFFEVAGARPRPPIQTPAQVAELALRGLRERRAVVVCGGRNRALAALTPRLPAGLVTRVAGRGIRRWQKLA
ncbi:MAG TPA: SDR family oxidoreductase [Terriglobales bacterium]|nr:SDR family oxidoreductase [Terriglobales bacterium]